MPATSGQHMRRLYRIDRGHGPLLQAFNFALNTVCTEYPLREKAQDVQVIPYTLLNSGNPQ